MGNIKETILKHQFLFSKVVAFNPTHESIVQMDFSLENGQLTKELISDTEQFSQHVNSELQKHNAILGIGGYLEQRSLYQRSKIFGNTISKNSINGDLQIEEPRTLHLGIDIWGNAGTPVFAPLDGVVHSFAFNDNFGDDIKWNNPHLLFFLLSFSLQPLFSFYLLLLQLLGLIRV